MTDYHKLEVWHLACQLSDDVAILLDPPPPGMRAAAIDQLARSSDSIHENISEGAGYDSDRQFAKYLHQACGSADEVQDQLEKLKRRKQLEPRFHELLPATRLICKKLTCLIATVESSDEFHGRAPRHRRPSSRRPKAKPKAKPKAVPDAEAVSRSREQAEG